MLILLFVSFCVFFVPFLPSLVICGNAYIHGFLKLLCVSLPADITLQWLIQHSRTKRSSWEQTRHQQNRPRPPQTLPLKTLLPFPRPLYNYLLTPNPYALIPRLYSAEVLRCSKVSLNQTEPLHGCSQTVTTVPVVPAGTISRLEYLSQFVLVSHLLMKMWLPTQRYLKLIRHQSECLLSLLIFMSMTAPKKHLHFRVPSFSRRVLVWSWPHRHGVSASLQVHTASSNFVTTALNHSATRFEQKKRRNQFSPQFYQRVCWLLCGSVPFPWSFSPLTLPSLRPNCIPFSPPLLVFLPPHPRPSILSHFCPHPWWTAPQLLFSVFPSFPFILLDVLLPCHHVPPPPPPPLSPAERGIKIFLLHCWFCFCKIIMRIMLIIFLLWHNLVRLKEAVPNLLSSLFISM